MSIRLQARTPKELLELAPPQLRTKAGERYRGGGIRLHMDDFSLDEQDLFRRQYDLMKELRLLSDKARSGQGEDAVSLLQFLANNETLAIEEQLLQITYELLPRNNPQLGRAVFQLSTGAFAAITEYLPLLQQSGGLEPEYPQVLYYLARDHMKIMRSILRDLDPEGTHHDECPQAHSIDLLLEKWQSSEYRVFDRALQVQVVNHYRGNVAERCLEFAEIDQCFYHIANNCALYSSDQRLFVHVLMLPDGNNLRWVFSNRIDSKQAEYLESVRDQGESIFEHGVGSRGSGFGLGIVAETIAHAYGLDDLYEGLRDGHFGSRNNADSFDLWFHWPRAD